MDILFVHSNSSKMTFQSLIEYAAIEPPIWAALLANSMRNLGISVDILDCEALQLTTEQSYNHIKQMNPKLVCFVQFGQHPSASAQSMQGTHELLDLMDFEFKTILVGLYPSALPIIDVICVNFISSPSLYHKRGTLLTLTKSL